MRTLTIKAVIKAKRGKEELNTAKVYVRVTINRTAEYINTGITVNREDWNAELGRCKESKSKVKTELAREQNRQIESKIIEVELMHAKQGISTSQELKQQIITQQNAAESNFLEQFRTYCDWLKNQNRTSTYYIYNGTYNNLVLYNRSNKLTYSNLTSDYINKYIDWQRQKGKSNTIRKRIKNLYSVWNSALVGGIISHATANPFLNSKKMKTEVQHRALSYTEVSKLLNYEPIDQSEEYALDAFKFSYYLRGISLKDLALLTKENIQGNAITYIRRKTKKLYSITIPDEAQDIINKYSNEYSPLLFPILVGFNLNDDAEVTHRVNNQLQTINVSLRAIGEKLKLSCKLTTYVARHSYASVLLNNDVNHYNIMKLLGHSSITQTETYLQGLQEQELAEVSKLSIPRLQQ